MPDRVFHARRTLVRQAFQGQARCPAALLDRLNRVVMYNAPAVLGYLIAATLVGAATAVAWPLARWWWGALPDAHVALEGAAIGALGFLTYIAWGLSLLAVIALVRNVTRLSVPTGRYRMRDWAVTQFFVYNLLVMTARYLFLPFTRMTRFNILFYRAMGADVGKGCVINSAHVYDLNLLTFGDESMVGGSAVVMAHMGAGDDMYIEEVVIEDRASIGEGAIVFPGARIGEGAVVGAGSVVPRDTHVPAGARVQGVPVEVEDEPDEPL